MISVTYQVKLRKDSKIVIVHRCQFALDETAKVITEIINNASDLNVIPKMEHALREKQRFASVGYRGGYALRAAVAQGNFQLKKNLVNKIFGYLH